MCYVQRHVSSQLSACSRCDVTPYLQICADCVRQVGLVDDEEIALGDARAAFTRNLVTA